MTLEVVTINGTEIPVRAYLHPTSDDCVTAAYDGQGAAIYQIPRKLVAWDDVVDQADWLENGIAEWQAEALAAAKRTKHLAYAAKALLDALDLELPQTAKHCGAGERFNLRAAIAQIVGEQP